jgi:hypothetical protein
MCSPLRSMFGLSVELDLLSANVEEHIGTSLTWVWCLAPLIIGISCRALRWNPITGTPGSL